MKAVTFFRGVAVMVPIVESINANRFQSRQSYSRSVSSLPSYERISLTWRDILTLQAELIDAQNSSAFRRVANDAGNDDGDDESASIYSIAKSRLSVSDDRQSMFGKNSQGGIRSSGIISGGESSIINRFCTSMGLKTSSLIIFIFFVIVYLRPPSFILHWLLSINK